MAASDHLNINQSGRFVTLYRGLGGVSPDTVDVHQLGMHWTPNYDVASNYANVDIEGDEGTLIEAKIHKRHIIPENSEEWEKAAGRSGVFSKDEAGWGSWEQEHTIRSGAPVHVTQMTHFPLAGGSRDIARKDIPFSQLRKYRA